MIILALDTAAEFCAACVHDGERMLGRRSLDIGKGHAEALMDVIGAALAEAQLTYREIQAVAVSVGPGSFTGVRIGVAAARGLALALKIPAIGVSTLEALAFEARRAHPGRAVLAAIDAKRDEVYAALYDAGGRELANPMVTDAASARRLALDHGAVLAGSASPLISQGGDMVVASFGRTAGIPAYAEIAARKGASGERPKPLYLRGADAKPQAGFALPLKQDGPPAR